MTYFKNITDKLKLLESDQKLNELGGGLPSAVGRGLVNSLRRTTVGAGKRDLETKAKALNQKWLQYRGQTDAIPNKANIQAWVKDKLGMKTPEVWAQAEEEFKEANPKAGQKYDAEKPLDKYEVLNFFVKLVQIRLAYIDRDLQKPAQPAQAKAEPQHKADWWGNTNKAKNPGAANPAPEEEPEEEQPPEAEENTAQEAQKEQDHTQATETPRASAQDAVSALVNLGYDRGQASRAINAALRQDPNLSLQDLIKRGLASFGK